MFPPAFKCNVNHYSPTFFSSFSRSPLNDKLSLKSSITPMFFKSSMLMVISIYG
jgi:hypothetical protein